ncbi:MAG: hypothetical protein ABI910_11310 [Gemmatimonadota bacterium]
MTLAIFSLTACAGDPTSNEIPAPGDAAQVVALSVWHAGGHEQRQQVVVDSASQHFRVTRCDDAPIAVPCTNLRLLYEGTSPSNSLVQLFAATTTPGFHALNSSYSAPAGNTPPDGGSTRLEVVRNGTRRVITWASSAYLPAPLVTVNCLLLSAQLNKRLCD